MNIDQLHGLPLEAPKGFQPCNPCKPTWPFGDFLWNVGLRRCRAEEMVSFRDHPSGASPEDLKVQKETYTSDERREAQKRSSREAQNSSNPRHVAISTILIPMTRARRRNRAVCSGLCVALT